MGGLSFLLVLASGFVEVKLRAKLFLRKDFGIQPFRFVGNL